MKIFNLNIRGLGEVSKIRKLRDLLWKESVDFLTLQETILGGNADSVVKQFWTHGEYGFCQLPAVGRSGGLLCVWMRSSFNAISAFSGSTFFIVEGFWLRSSSKMSFINVYGPHNDVAHRLLWNDLFKLTLAQMGDGV